jgi:hypothetical protein
MVHTDKLTGHPMSIGISHLQMAHDTPSPTKDNTVTNTNTENTIVHIREPAYPVCTIGM